MTSCKIFNEVYFAQCNILGTKQDRARNVIRPRPGKINPSVAPIMKISSILPKIDFL